MKIELSTRAKLNLSAIRQHIAHDNKAAAERTVLRIIHSIRHLAQFPEMGRVWQESDTRALSIPAMPYRAHYQIVGDIVEIITIVHTRRKDPLLNED